MLTAFPQVNAGQIDQEAIDAYRHCGFIVVRGLLDRDEAIAYGRAALEVHQRVPDNHAADARLDQYVNAWRHDETMRQLTLDPRVAKAAQTIAGVNMRLWHDHVLIKKPHNKLPTEFHQDQAYWPHSNSPNALSCWLALCDVPPRRGCMSFIQGSHRLTDLPTQSLADDGSLFSIAPDLEYDSIITCPLRAGDCTFHHARTGHMANDNRTDEWRTAHVIAFMDATTTYHDARGGGHQITRPFDYQEGQLIEGELHPTTEQIIAGKCAPVSA